TPLPSLSTNSRRGNHSLPYKETIAAKKRQNLGMIRKDCRQALPLRFASLPLPLFLDHSEWSDWSRTQATPSSGAF
uniref:Uncharacterized protein n=1 Tax=Oryza brachyantha TaxID=4533 RepID=J3LM36_ORYBR